MKKLFGLGLSALSLFAIVACDKESEEKREATPLKVAVQYCGAQGITYDKATSYTGLDGVTYSRGNMLPVWRELESRLNLKFEDVMTGAKAEEQYDLYKASSFAGVDVLNATTKKLNDGGVDGGILDLGNYLDKMPNLKNLLDNCPDVKASCFQDGHLYFAPYYDGYGEPNRYMEMRTDWVEKILDTETTTIESQNVRKTLNYTKFNDYGTANTTVQITKQDSNGNYSLATLNKKTANTDVIGAQADDATNRDLINTLKAHLNTVYGDNVGTGKTYAKLSEIFTSVSAAYDTDELVALMRCIYSSSKSLTGTDKEICMLIPRDSSSSRMMDIVRWGCQVFGARGASSTNGFLYIDGNGTVQDGRCNDRWATMITKMNELYKEGLITQQYNQCNYTTNAFRTEVINDNVFMGWDFLNSSVDSLTKKADGTYANYVGVLPPVVKWEVSNGNYQYYQFNEDNRGIKSDAWGIPARVATDEKTLNAALSLVDYFYSNEGNELISYGPSQWHEGNGKKVSAISGDEIDNFTFSQACRDDWDKQAESEAGLTWINYLRDYVGSNLCVGYIRDANVEMDLAFNDLCIDAHDMLLAAKGTGSFITGSGAGSKGLTNFNNFTKSVPSFTLDPSQQQSVKDNKDSIESIFSSSNHYLYIIKGWGVDTNVSLADYKAIYAAGSSIQTGYIAQYQSAYQTYLADLANN